MEEAAVSNLLPSVPGPHDIQNRAVPAAWVKGHPREGPSHPTKFLILPDAPLVARLGVDTCTTEATSSHLRR